VATGRATLGMQGGGAKFKTAEENAELEHGSSIAPTSTNDDAAFSSESLNRAMVWALVTTASCLSDLFRRAPRACPSPRGLPPELKLASRPLSAACRCGHAMAEAPAAQCRASIGSASQLCCGRPLL